jgi:phosphate transport system substrate-binding protein
MSRFTGRIFSQVVAFLLILVGPVVSVQAQLRPQIDPKIPTYVTGDPVAGSLTIVGSKTMQPLTESWADELEKRHPSLKVHVESAGSESGLSQFLEGRVQIVAMSRRITIQEINEFIREFGHEPTEVPVAVDALAVFVHKDNPVASITLQDLDAMFCKERRRGALYAIDTWGLLGLDEDWFTASVHPYGFHPGSGTATFVKDHVCSGGPLNPSMPQTAGAASVVMELMQDRLGIGFSGIGYRTTSVRPVPVASVRGGRFVEPTFQAVMDGSYPLRRNLYLYINRPPKTLPQPAIVEFVKFAVSQQGQQAVVTQGYFPLPAGELQRLATAWSAPIKAAQIDRPRKLRD